MTGWLPGLVSSAVEERKEGGQKGGAKKAKVKGELYEFKKTARGKEILHGACSSKVILCARKKIQRR